MMAIKFDSVKVGDELWDVRRTKGLGKFRGKWDSFRVYVKEIDTVNQRALVSWNGNAPEWKPARHIEKYRRSRPNEARHG